MTYLNVYKHYETKQHILWLEQTGNLYQNWQLDDCTALHITVNWHTDS